MREGADLGQVGRWSDEGEDSAGVEDIDSERAQVHKLDFFILRSTQQADSKIKEGLWLG